MGKIPPELGFRNKTRKTGRKFNAEIKIAIKIPNTTKSYLYGYKKALEIGSSALVKKIRAKHTQFAWSGIREGYNDIHGLHLFRIFRYIKKEKGEFKGEIFLN